MRYILLIFLLFACGIKNENQTPVFDVPKDFITAEKLLKNGFKYEEKNKYYSIKGVKISKIMDLLGFVNAEMEDYSNLPHGIDERWVETKNYYCHLESIMDVINEGGNKVKVSLDSPDAICDVWIRLYSKSDLDEIAKAQKNKFKVGGSPKITINSIETSKTSNETLMINFTLEARNNLPLALAQNQFSIRIFSSEDHSELFCSEANFLNNVSNPIKIKEGEKISITIEIKSDYKETKKKWCDLPNGKYFIKIYLNSSKSQDFDYQWLGQTYSDRWNFTLPFNRQ